MKIEYAKTNVFMNFLFFNNKINRNNEEKKINFRRYQIHLCTKIIKTTMLKIHYPRRMFPNIKFDFFLIIKASDWNKTGDNSLPVFFFFVCNFWYRMPLSRQTFFEKSSCIWGKKFFVNGWIVKCMSVHLSFRPHFHHAVLTFDWQMKVTPWYFLFLFFRWTTSTWCCSGRSVWFIYVCN